MDKEISPPLRIHFDFIAQGWLKYILNGDNFVWPKVLFAQMNVANE